MISIVKNNTKYLIILVLLLLYMQILWGQNSVSPQLSNAQKEEEEICVKPPEAVPVFTEEEANIVNQETLQELKYNKEKRKAIELANIKEWRKSNYNTFFKRVLFSLIGVIGLLIPCSFCLKKSKQRMTDLLKKILLSLFCSTLLLLLLFSAIPYFYDFWSIGSLCLGCVIWSILFQMYDFIFILSKKDILIIPLLFMGTWILLYKINPRMEDIPNTIVLNAETNGVLTYNGTVSNNKAIRAKADFLAHYNYIELNEEWKQFGSYKASLKRDKGQFVLYLPTELIQKYNLGIKLTASATSTRGTLVINGCEEIPWRIKDKSKVLYLMDYSQHLYLDSKNCPMLFKVLCTIGAAIFVFLIIRLAERVSILFSSNKQKAIELTFLIVCILFFAINLKNAFFIDNNSDLDDMASNIPIKFTTKHPPMIYAWWMFFRFVSPFYSINVAYVLGLLMCFWCGIWLIGDYFIKQKEPAFAFLIFLSCVNLVSSAILSTIFYVDNIVVSTCLLALGLCTRLCFTKRFTKAILSITICLLILVLLGVRLEGLSYSAPISIVLVSLTLFKKFKGFKRVFMSCLIGSILAIFLNMIYTQVISPRFFHAQKIKNAAIDNILRESLGICYFSKDWDDLPDFFSDEAKEKLDRSQFIERPFPYRIRYLPKATMEQIRLFWLHMIKKHPLAYLKVKWVGNQILWRYRLQFIVPINIRAENDPTETGLSVRNFFKDGLTTNGLVLPTWLVQLSLLFIFLFVGGLLFKFNDPGLWIIWGIGASGFLHNFTFFLISAAPNYRYIYWADTSGRISFILSMLIIKKLFDFNQNKKLLINTLNENDVEIQDETLCSNSLFQ